MQLIFKRFTGKFKIKFQDKLRLNQAIWSMSVSPTEVIVSE